MKQTTPMKWIEGAEARVVCELAVMEPGKVKIARYSEPHMTMQRIRLFGLFSVMLCLAGRHRNDRKSTRVPLS